MADSKKTDPETGKDAAKSLWSKSDDIVDAKLEPLEEAVTDTIEDITDSLDEATDAADDALEEVVETDTPEGHPEDWTDPDDTAAQDTDPDETFQDEAELRELDPEETPETDPDSDYDYDDTVEDMPEPEPIIEERVVERVIEKRGGFFPALIGGLLAAVVGFMAARTEILDPYLPGWLRSANLSEQIAALETTINEQAGTLSELGATVTAVDDRVAAISVPDLAPLTSELAALSDGAAALTGQIAALDGKSTDLDAKVSDIGATFNSLDTRLSDLEKRPITEGVSPAAIAAYERELAAMQETVASQRSEVEALIAKSRADAEAMEAEARAMEAAARQAEAEAEAKVQAAANKAQAALLRAALDDGAPYSAVITALEQGGVAIPDALGAQAGDGVATLATLQSEFPDAARAALKAARNAGTAEAGNVTSFLQRQLGARSVEPRDGDDPDAVLSRIQAAVTAGQLGAALDEITKLPDAAKAALATWSDQAQSRFDALQAAESLVQSLNTN